MLKIAICDDDTRVVNYIKSALATYAIEKVFSTEGFSSAEDLYKHLHEESSVDLIFLDIELGQMNGVALGKKIRTELDDHVTKIVYISGRDSYDRQLFHVQPLFFLPKPIDEKGIYKAVELTLKLKFLSETTFEFKLNKQLVKILAKDIFYFEGHNHKIKLFSRQGEFEFYGRISEIAKELSGAQFLYIHKSYCVNYRYISSQSAQIVTLLNGKNLPVGRSKLKDVAQALIHIAEEE